MDLGITNICIFYLKSWLILLIVISQPSFDYRLTMAIYLTTSLEWINIEWINIKGTENLDRFILQNSTIRFHGFQELNKDFVLLHPFKSLIAFYSTQVIPPGVSS